MLDQLPLICGIFFFAGVVQGTAGFGFGLTSLALLGSVIDLRIAAILSLFGALIINVVIFLPLKQYFTWERMRPFFLTALAGVPVGVFCLQYFTGDILQLFIGVLLIGGAIHGLVPALAKHKWHPLWAGIPCGFISGTLTGAFGTGGPPAVAYVSSQNFDRRTYVTILQIIFMVGGLVRLAILAGAGIMTADLSLASFIGGVCAGAGAFLGIRVLRRLSNENLRKLVAILLLMMGIKHLVV